MSLVGEPNAAHTAEAWFDVERLEVHDGILVLTGYWTGIRGRRFVRPTLMLTSGRDPHRLLASIDDKPWAAEEGRLWRAAFPWELEGADVANVELTVATDIIIPLPAPEGIGVAGAGSAPRPTRTQEAARLKREVRDLRAQLEQVTAEATRLRSTLEGAESAAVETAAVVARRDSALAKLEEVSAERDQALEATRRATAERDEVLRRAGAERDDQLRRTTEERDAALAERNRAANELARARHQIDQLLDRSEVISRESRQYQAERDGALRALDARSGAAAAEPPPAAEPAITRRAPAPAPAPAPASPSTPVAPARTATFGTEVSVPPQPVRLTPVSHRRDLRNASWGARALAITLLVVFVIVLALILKVL